MIVSLQHLNLCNPVSTLGILQANDIGARLQIVDKNVAQAQRLISMSTTLTTGPVAQQRVGCIIPTAHNLITDTICTALGNTRIQTLNKLVAQHLNTGVHMEVIGHIRVAVGQRIICLLFCLKDILQLKYVVGNDIQIVTSCHRQKRNRRNYN